MNISNLILLIPNRQDIRVLINIGMGPYRTPGNIHQLQESLDIVINGDFPRQEVSAADFLDDIHKFRDGDIEIEVRDEPFAGHYKLMDVKYVPTNKFVPDRLILICERC